MNHNYFVIVLMIGDNTFCLCESETPAGYMFRNDDWTQTKRFHNEQEAQHYKETLFPNRKDIAVFQAIPKPDRSKFYGQAVQLV